LKTPLAVIQAESELALRETDLAGGAGMSRGSMDPAGGEGSGAVAVAVAARPTAATRQRCALRCPLAQTGAGWAPWPASMGSTWVSMAAPTAASPASRNCCKIGNLIDNAVRYAAPAPS
jgi:two-component system sensor histidine kinase TctE